MEIEFMIWFWQEPKAEICYAVYYNYRYPAHREAISGEQDIFWLFLILKHPLIQQARLLFMLTDRLPRFPGLIRCYSF